jgi:shikimate dehydrogenase
VRLAVIGHPVAHSRSPAMQNAALAALGLGEEWSYEAIDVPPEGFEERVRALEGEGFAGANVTVPHKEAALALADVASEVAKEIGAANTLVFAEGAIQAHNTDAGGLIASLPGSTRARRALVLGAGGAARAAIWALSAEGAVVDVTGVDAWNRTPSRADAVYAELGRFVELGGAPVEAFRQDAYGIIVNTTAVGLHGEDPFEHLPLERTGFDREQVIVDMVYGERPSPLLAAAEAAGATVVDGIEVLVQQGALSLQIWTGREPPLDVMRMAARL